jgi:hypothetical protein
LNWNTRSSKSNSTIRAKTVNLARCPVLGHEFIGK